MEVTAFPKRVPIIFLPFSGKKRGETDNQQIHCLILPIENVLLALKASKKFSRTTSLLPPVVNVHLDYLKHMKLMFLLFTLNKSYLHLMTRRQSQLTSQGCHSNVTGLLLIFDNEKFGISEKGDLGFFEVFRLFLRGLGQFSNDICEKF